MPKKVRKIGLLGGGQLARMLALRGHELGFEIHVLSRQASDPAAQVVRRHVAGDPNDSNALRDFLGKVDVATFESEFLNSSTLATVAQETGIPLRPAPALMGELQDRLSQKQALLDYGLPTLPFRAIDSLDAAKDFLAKYAKSGIVLKQRRFGYDGYGTFHVRTLPQLRNVFSRWRNLRADLIGEPRCPFRRELAITLVRDRHQNVRVFPLVESRQVDSRCHWVKGPVFHRQAPSLIRRLRRFLNQIDYIGAIAFEIFDTRTQGLVLNEIAPRVHNSAHYSLDALSLDQFSAHLIAISGAHLPKVQNWSKGFAMVNLLGRSNGPVELAVAPDVRLHWYGKLENRPGRKMGHLNALAHSADQALQRARRAERKFKL